MKPNQIKRLTVDVHLASLESVLEINLHEMADDPCLH